MKCFGLADSPPSGFPPPRRLISSVLFGGVSFSVVSLLAYSIWAFRLVPGTAGLYTTTALVYVGLGGLALSRLVAAPGAWKRFPPCFALAFLAYAAGWCVFWFGLRGRYQADLFGAADGHEGEGGDAKARERIRDAFAADRAVGAEPTERGEEGDAEPRGEASVAERGDGAEEREPVAENFLRAVE
jgi:hypothetical protein